MSVTVIPYAASICTALNDVPEHTYPIETFFPFSPWIDSIPDLATIWQASRYSAAMLLMPPMESTKSSFPAAA